MVAPVATFADPFADPKKGAGGPVHVPVGWDVVDKIRTGHLASRNETTGGRRPTVSVSKVNAITDCGLRVQLDWAARPTVQLVPAARPSWAAIGGNAFHVYVEAVERLIHAGTDAPTALLSIAEQGWTAALDQATTDALEASGGAWSVNDVRASNKGLEGFDWWRVKGQEMCEKYLRYHDEAYRAAGRYIPTLPHSDLLPLKAVDGVVPTGGLMLERKFVLPSPGGYDFTGYIDSVWFDLGEPFIHDLKTGATAPTLFQLASYSHALSAATGIPNIKSRYWDARAGKYSEVVDAATRIPVTEVDRRLTTAHRAERDGLLLPRPSNWCNGCSHAAICPARETA